MSTLFDSLIEIQVRSSQRSTDDFHIPSTRTLSEPTGAETYYQHEIDDRAQTHHTSLERSFQGDYDAIGIVRNSSVFTEKLWKQVD